MRFIQLIALPLLLAATLITAKESSGKKSTDVACQNNVMHQLDSYLKQIELVPNGKHKFPDTIGKLKDACKINTNIMSIMTNLANKCMTGFKKNVMQVSLYSVRKSQKTLCRAKPTKEMRDFVAAGKCVNGGTENFRKCIRVTVNNILKVKYTDDKLKIPLICCEIVRAKQCLMKEAKKVRECKDEHIETINNRFNAVASNGLNLACGDYSEETDRCSKIHAPKVHIEKSNKSLVMTMFELLDDLPGNTDILPGGN